MCMLNNNYRIFMIYHRHTLSRTVREDWLGSCNLVPDVAAADFTAMLRRMVLGEVVGEVVGSGSPRDGIFATLHSITDPVIPHIDGFGALEADGVVGETDSSCVVRDNRGSGLRIAKVSKSEA